jgi:hypothetical protein
VTPTRRTPPGCEGRSAASGRSDYRTDSTAAEREVEVRVRSAATVLAAVERGHWPATPEIIDGVGAVLAAASSWAAIVELEAA